jgi:hypothetical protein
VYAATAKLLEFNHFRIQLGRSPLLSAFAGFVAWSVPAIEFVTAGLLASRKYRNIGLLAAFGLMTMFTTYIVIILNFSAFVPCSCGGILEKMGWKEHLVFNIFFVVIGLIGLLLNLKLNANFRNIRRWQLRHFGISVFSLFTFSIGFVTLLYALSEQEVHRNNSFLRRYPHLPAQQVKGFALTYDSYYISGFADGKIYLGNVTAPLQLLQVDTTLTTGKSFSISLADGGNHPFSSVHVSLRAPYFYLSDGTVPIIYQGKIGEWKASPILSKTTRFNIAEPVSGDAFAIRNVDVSANANVLGLLCAKNQLLYDPELLKKQQVGIFETDGLLSYNEELHELVYMYFYSNDYVVADLKLKPLFYGHTVDTVSKPQIEIAYEDSTRTRTMAKQPAQINNYSCTAGRYFFVKSDRLGRYEPESMLKHASIVDVYDLIKHTYEFSFYLYDHENEKVKSFRVYGNLLVGLTDHYLVTYKLRSDRFDFSAPD